MVSRAPWRGARPTSGSGRRSSALERAVSRPALGPHSPRARARGARTEKGSKDETNPTRHPATRIPATDVPRSRRGGSEDVPQRRLGGDGAPALGQREDVGGSATPDGASLRASPARGDSQEHAGRGPANFGRAERQRQETVPDAS